MSTLAGELQQTVFLMTFYHNNPAFEQICQGNSADPDQTAHVGYQLFAIQSLFVYLMLTSTVNS